jgi:hypothetical protein
VPPAALDPGEQAIRTATEFGMQQGRDEVLAGHTLPDGRVLYETEVTAYSDARGRLRYRGNCVQGPPEEPFLYISYRNKGVPGWIGRGKAHLTSLSEDFFVSLPDGAVLESTISSLGHRERGHAQVWRLVDSS